MTDFDVVVVGSGLAGSAAAEQAARAGAKVALLEKQEDFGGSAALSAGMLWTAPSVEAYERRIPLGDKTLANRLIADYEAAIAHVRALGVRVSDEPMRGIMTYGIGYSSDIHALLAGLRDGVVSRGGVVEAARPVKRLIFEGTRIAGVVVTSGALDVEYRARTVVLATGGFGRDAELLARYLGVNSDRVLYRSNRGSVGDGLRLAASAGAGSSRAMSSFYGHLVPWPLERFEPEHYLPYSQYYSGAAVLLNLSGERFIDETLGDEILNQGIVSQPEARGVLVFDEHVRATEATDEPFPGLGAHDRFETAKRAGAAWATADTLDALAVRIGEWGVDEAVVSRTLHEYVSAAQAGGYAGGVPVSVSARAPQAAPFHAVMVQPSLTFTFGGVPVTVRGEVVDHDGNVIPALYAAGADIGGLSNIGYAGGLAPALITGRWAGTAAAEEAKVRV